MKNLFGDDDDDDDDDDDNDEVATATAAAATATLAVGKDDSQHKTDHDKPAEKAKKRSLPGHKKTPEKAHSSKSHTPPAVRGRSDKTDVQSLKATNGLSSSHASDKHRRQHSESGVDKRSRDAAKSSGKPVSAAAKPDSAASRSKPVTSDFAAKSSKVSQSVGAEKKKTGAESGACGGDLSLSDSDTSDSSEANDVDVCDARPEKPPSSGEDQPRESHTAAVGSPSPSREARAANGEYVAVLLDLQKRLMSVADDETLEKLTTMVEETGKYSITTDTFDFDLCQLDIRTVNKLKHFLATVAC